MEPDEYVKHNEHVECCEQWKDTNGRNTRNICSTTNIFDRAYEKGPYRGGHQLQSKYIVL